MCMANETPYSGPNEIDAWKIIMIKGIPVQYSPKTPPPYTGPYYGRTLKINKWMYARYTHKPDYLSSSSRGWYVCKTRDGARRYLKIIKKCSYLFCGGPRVPSREFAVVKVRIKTIIAAGVIASPIGTKIIHPLIEGYRAKSIKFLP